MSFFKKLFGVKSDQPQFEEGDVFYCMLEGQFHLYKVLKVDTAFPTYHVLCYKALDELPPQEKSTAELEVLVYHSPIAITGFEKPELFIHEKVLPSDLVGYYEYLRQTGNVDELVKLANGYYQTAYRLTDRGRHREAIEEYSNAIEVIPQFFEAIDNRAFCKMDLALYNDAIVDLNSSLSVQPDAFGPVFSIGECYLRLQQFEKAKEYFEKALIIEPDNEAGKMFLQKAVNREIQPVPNRKPKPMNYTERLEGAKAHYPFVKWREMFFPDPEGDGDDGMEQYTQENCDAARTIFDNLINGLDAIGENAPENSKLELFETAIEKLNALSAEVEDLIETVEREDLCLLIDEITIAAGLNPKDYADGEGIADLWRDW